MLFSDQYLSSTIVFQALWRTLKNPQDATAATAFRVLGKFGGGNRKMLREPQKVLTFIFVLQVFKFSFGNENYLLMLIMADSTNMDQDCPKIIKFSTFNNTHILYIKRKGI